MGVSAESRDPRDLTKFCEKNHEQGGMRAPWRPQRAEVWVWVLKLGDFCVFLEVIVKAIGLFFSLWCDA